MKKENVIVMFYVIYFTWLFTVAFLTPSISVLNIFTSIVTIIYFFFLREKGDLFWFWLSAMVPILFAVVSFHRWQFKTDFEMLKFLPLWLPLAWGTTIVALRKFYILVSK